MARHMRNGRDYSRPGPKVDYELREGSNNAARSGEVYDKIKEIQSQIVPTASIERGETASKAYNIGDFLVKDEILYKVTKAIVKGDTLTVGTNIAMTTVRSELSEKSNSTNYKLIWTNPNDESNFNAQTITLDETGTVFLLDIVIDNAIDYICRFGLSLSDSIMNLIRKVEQKKGKRKVVIILSDGRDQNSRFSKDQLIETLSNSGLPVYTVGMKVLSNQSLSNLDEISQLTGGTYYYSTRFKDIPDNLKKVVDCIKQSYIVKLKVKNVKGDDQAHLLEIKVEETESKGRGVKTFIAVKHPIPRWLQLVFLALAIILFVGVIVLLIVKKSLKRKSMGITRRRCPDCRSIMKDNWESCPFCKYMPELARKKSKKNKGKK